MRNHNNTMKPSFLRCWLIPFLLSSALATWGGWFTFKKICENNTNSIVNEALKPFSGITQTADYHTVSLSGLVASPEAKAAAESAVESINGGWGVRVEGKNGIFVAPSLTAAQLPAGGLALSGWVHQGEKAALVELAAKEGGYTADQVDASGVRELSYVTAAGAAAVAAATAADSAEGKPLAWMSQLWQALPKPATATAAIAPDGGLMLTGMVADTAAKADLVAWTHAVRPDLKIDDSGVQMVPGTRALQIPAAGAALAAGSALAGIWETLKTPAVVAYQTASGNAPASLTGRVRTPEEATALAAAAKLPDAAQLVVSPAVQPGKLETAALTKLLHTVSELKDGSLNYSASGLEVRGAANLEQEAALKAVPLGEMNAAEVRFGLIPAGLPVDPALAATLMENGTLKLTGVVPSQPAKDGLVSTVKALRPDVLTVDGSGLKIDAACKALALPAAGGLASLSPNALKSGFSWMSGLVDNLSTGPSLAYAAVGPDGRPTAKLAGPTEWTQALAAGASLPVISAVKPLSSGLMTVGPGDPAGAALGQLVKLVSGVKGGAVRYDRANGLVVEGEPTAEQLAAIKGVPLAPLPPEKTQLKLTVPSAPAVASGSPASAPPGAMANAGNTAAAPGTANPQANPMAAGAPAGGANAAVATNGGAAVGATSPLTTGLSAKVVDGALEFSGPVPDEAARKMLLDAAKAGAPGIEVADKTTLAPGTSSKAAALLGGLAAQLSAEPGNRTLTLTEKGYEVAGEVTSGMLKKWESGLKQLEKAGFEAPAAPQWTVLPSVFHFASRKIGAAVAGVDETAIKALSEALKSNNVFFDTGSSRVSGAEQGKIDALVTAVKAYSGKIKFVIGGHADNRGDPAANQRLSIRRVNSVLAALKDGGLDTGNFQQEAFGASQASGSDPAALAACRRVEILIK
jgi:outer membrane protein OmpA-like peptidoglycan-associated protein